jgi:hypothetical protein
MAGDYGDRPREFNGYAHMVLRLFRNGWTPDEPAAFDTVARLTEIIRNPLADGRTHVAAAKAMLECAKFCHSEQMAHAHYDLEKRKLDGGTADTDPVSKLIADLIDENKAANAGQEVRG